MQINIYPTTSSQKMTELQLMAKLTEEHDEIINAIYKKDYDNLAEEIFDVIQMCVNTLQYYGIDHKKGEFLHHRKLILRGHDFILGGEKNV